MKKAIIYAILAAAFYAVATPCEKYLLTYVSPGYLAAFLYLGAGLGMLVIWLVQHKKNRKAPLRTRDLPYTVAMVVLDILAPIFLMLGLRLSDAANVSLLNNFEIVSTAVIASAFFHEKSDGKTWLGIGFITMACMILSVQDAGAFHFCKGSVYVVIACICWGIENNCTRCLSQKDPVQIVVIKGLGSGSGALLVAALTQSTFPNLIWLLPVLLLGFFAYGLSITCYVRAQRDLGAARTSAYYAISPFIAAGLSVLIFHTSIRISFLAGLILMLLGTGLLSLPSRKHDHASLE